MITVDEERMAEFFCKYHLRGLPVGAVLHHFGSADAPDAPPHDHPWPFRSFIVSGGYVERVFQLDGSSELVHRKPGDSFQIEASHIHRIEELPEGECWTLIIPGQHERTSGFYEFREDGTYQRRWNESEWTRLQEGGWKD